jgi:hypothetical protein
MREYARVNVGITPHGIQVWCVRHNIEICHITPQELAEIIAEATPAEGAA